MPADLVSGEHLFPDSHRVLSSHGERVKGALSGLSYKDTKSIYGVSALITYSPPNTHLQILSHWGLGFNT